MATRRKAYAATLLSGTQTAGYLSRCLRRNGKHYGRSAYVTNNADAKTLTEIMAGFQTKGSRRSKR